MKKSNNNEKIGRLIAALKEKDFSVRGKAVTILGELGDPRAVISLLLALEDKDEFVKWRASVSLEKISDKVGLEPFIQCLKHNNTLIRKNAADFLEKLSWKPTDVTERVHYFISKQVII